MEHNYTKVSLKAQNDPETPEKGPDKKGKLCFFRHRRRLFISMSFFYEKVFYCNMVINLHI